VSATEPPVTETREVAFWRVIEVAGMDEPVGIHWQVVDLDAVEAGDPCSEVVTELISLARRPATGRPDHDS
jgi:hypothetical protein